MRGMRFPLMANSFAVQETKTYHNYYTRFCFLFCGQEFNLTVNDIADGSFWVAKTCV